MQPDTNTRISNENRNRFFIVAGFEVSKINSFPIREVDHETTDYRKRLQELNNPIENLLIVNGEWSMANDFETKHSPLIPMQSGTIRDS